jgi:adenosylhomocysteinase
MRFGIRAREAVAITLLTLLVVGTTTTIHLTQLSRLVVEDAARQADLVAKQIYAQSGRALQRAAGRRPEQVLKGDRELRAQLEASVGYSPHLLYALIANRGGRTVLHTERREQLPEVRGGTEETTTGVIRLRAMAAEGVLAYPIVAVNEARTKHMFDNQYGTGQSAIDGLLRSTNVLIAGKTGVVCGYGWVGRGVAERLRGMGAIVLVCEVDPLRALAHVEHGGRDLLDLGADAPHGLLCRARRAHRGLHLRLERAGGLGKHQQLRDRRVEGLLGAGQPYRR